MERRPGSVAAVVVAVALAAAGALAWDAAAGTRRGMFGPRPAVFAILAGCCVLSELRPLQWLRNEDGGEVTASWTFLVALVLLGSPLLTAAVAAAAFVIGDVVGRKALVKVVFNAAQIVVCVSLATAVLRATGQSDDLLRSGALPLVWFPAAIAAGVVAFATNTLLTAVVIACNSKQPVRRIVRSNIAMNLSTDGLLVALSPIFVVVAERSLLLVPLVLVAAWTVYSTARVALARQHDASHDLLTELPNRRLFDQRLREAVSELPPEGGPLSVVVIDLDRFKEVNDRFGHEIGDLVLRELSHRLRETCRSGDLPARLGGDEFAVLTTSDGERLARQLHQAFARPCTPRGVPIRVGASIGVVSCVEGLDDATIMLRRADEAMYQAKSGGGGIRVASDADTRGVSRLGLLTDLTRALDPSQLTLHYQPLVELATHRLLGVEALLRWNHPELGLVMPATFMPLAEQTDLIGPITEWVLNEALRQRAAWQRAGLNLRMAVNVSARNIADTEFPTTVERALRANNVSPDTLDLEITENAFAPDHRSVRHVLNELRDMGITISIDDFGTGYSSMAQLREVPADQLKLDQRFVTNMATNDTDASIVKAIVALARALHLTTLAEGVEDPLTASLLRDLGCQRAQGYLFGRPMPPNALQTWIGVQEPVGGPFAHTEGHGRSQPAPGPVA